MSIDPVSWARRHDIDAAPGPRPVVERQLGLGCPRPRAPRPPLDPLSRRLLQIAAVLSVLLVAIVVDAWLEAGAGNPLNPIAQAAERTERAAGARLTFEAIYSSPATTRRVVMHGHGVYNGQTGRSRATMTIPESLQSIEMEAVGDQQGVFLRSSLISEGLPPGKKWMGIEPLLGQTSETAFGGSSNPSSQLEMLESVGADVESVGHQDVQGMPTTRYRGSFYLRGFAGFLDREGKRQAAREYEQLAKQMPSKFGVEVWIDGEGLVRQSRMVMTIPTTAAQPTISMDMRVDYSDFGITPTVRLPNPNYVFDATPLARAQLHLLDGSSAYSDPACG